MLGAIAWLVEAIENILFAAGSCLSNDDEDEDCPPRHTPLSARTS